MIAKRTRAASRDVGRMVDSSQADDRKLIRLVRARRLLYARNNMPVASYYTQVKQLWDDVARHMGWSVADVRRKWSHIRNSYSRHLRNEMHGTCTSRGRMVSRWYLADELEFLREHMATDMRPTSYSPFSPSMVEMELSESAPEPVDVKPFLQSPWFRLGASPSPPHDVPPDDAPPDDAPPDDAPPDDAPPDDGPHDDSTGSSVAAFAPSETAAYFQFFRGLYDDYQELPGRKQRLFRRRCLGLLHELLDAEAAGQHGALNLSHAGRAADECYILPTAGS